MVNYKLTYFFSRGYGEVSRQLFHLSDTPFEEKRWDISPEWKKHKDEFPFGQLPVLEVDGKQVPQSFAIARYLAKQFGFAGKTDFEAAWVDALGDQYKDYIIEHRPFIICGYGFNPSGDKEELKKTVGEPARDKFFPIIEKRLVESKSGFLVGDSLTWIDLVVADHVDVLLNNVPGYLEKYPKVIAHRDKINSIPKLREWIEKRPKSAF